MNTEYVSFDTYVIQRRFDIHTVGLSVRFEIFHLFLIKTWTYVVEIF